MYRICRPTQSPTNIGMSGFELLKKIGIIKLLESSLVSFDIKRLEV